MPPLSATIASDGQPTPGAAINSGTHRRCVPSAGAFSTRYGRQVCGEPTTGSDH